MRLPTRTTPVQRHAGRTRANAAGVTASGRIYVTGKADCKKGRNLLFTASATICGNTSNFHQSCSAAKAQAVADIATECRAAGGIPSQAGDSCTAGSKC